MEISKLDRFVGIGRAEGEEEWYAAFLLLLMISAVIGGTRPPEKFAPAAGHIGVEEE